jgi:pyruvate decarboxylase
MSKHISVATTILDDPAVAGSEIDRVLTTMMLESRPVYIGVPADLSHFPIDSEELDVPLGTALPLDDSRMTSDTIAIIRKRLNVAKWPALIIDGCKQSPQ